MNILSKLGIAAGMLSQSLVATGRVASSTLWSRSRIKDYRVVFVHSTKKGPGRSKGVKKLPNRAGSKIAKQAFNGMCTLRNGCGAAGRLAIEGKLGKKSD